MTPRLVPDRTMLRRSMAGLLLTGALTTALVGCGRATAPASSPAPASTSTSVTQPATASTPDPVDSIDQLLDQSERDADSVN